MKKYTKELKVKVIKLHLEGRSKKSLTEEYELGQGTLTYWLQQYREEAKSNPKLQEETDQAQEIRRLKKELAEAQKENSFLKKAAAFFAKEIE